MQLGSMVQGMSAGPNSLLVLLSALSSLAVST